MRPQRRSPSRVSTHRNWLRCRCRRINHTQADSTNGRRRCHLRKLHPSLEGQATSRMQSSASARKLAASGLPQQTSASRHAVDSVTRGGVCNNEHLDVHVVVHWSMTSLATFMHESSCALKVAKVVVLWLCAFDKGRLGRRCCCQQWDVVNRGIPYPQQHRPPRKSKADDCGQCSCDTCVLLVVLWFLDSTLAQAIMES